MIGGYLRRITGYQVFIYYLSISLRISLMLRGSRAFGDRFAVCTKPLGANRMCVGTTTIWEEWRRTTFEGIDESCVWERETDENIDKR